MLKFLSIRDFVIVDHVELEFAPGFTVVLTGETGAGKSILIDALSLVLGERSDPSDVRSGCERAEFSVEFDIRGLPELAAWLCDNGFEGDSGDTGVCLMRRLVDSSGRSCSFINGCSATLQQLRAAGEKLVDIQGQHGILPLLRADAQRDLLDSFSGNRELAQRVAEAYRHWQAIRQRRLDWEQNSETLTREREHLEWQSSELSALNFSLDEWEALQADHSRLSNAASLLEAAQMGLEVLSEGEAAALGQVNVVISRLTHLLDCDSSLKPLLELLDSAQIQLQEAVYELGDIRAPGARSAAFAGSRGTSGRDSCGRQKIQDYAGRVAGHAGNGLERLAGLGRSGDGDALAKEEAASG